MAYRIDINGLLRTFSVWNGFLRRRVRVIACGGTAMTLLGFKDSTKDIDLIAPDASEYRYLVKILQQIGYRQAGAHRWASEDRLVFDIFAGSFVHTTELLESPLAAGNHTFVKEFAHIYLGVLNDYDLIISKLFRGLQVDIEDCQALLKHRAGKVDLNRLTARYRETASYSISEEKVNRSLDLFLERIAREG